MKNFLLYAVSCLLFLILMPAFCFGCSKSDKADKKTESLYSLSKYELKTVSGYFIEKYEGNEQIVEMPSTYKDTKIIAIGERAFYNNEYINQVTIGKNVLYINEEAFSGAVNLSKVNFNSKLEFIGEKAFYCVNLSGELLLPNSLKEIQASAFENSSLLTTIKLNPSTIISPSAFKNCHNISKFIFDGGTIDDISTLVNSMAVEFDTIKDNVEKISIEIYDKDIRAELEEQILRLGFTLV